VTSARLARTTRRLTRLAGKPPRLSAGIGVRSLALVKLDQIDLADVPPNVQIAENDHALEHEGASPA